MQHFAERLIKLIYNNSLIIILLAVFFAFFQFYLPSTEPNPSAYYHHMEQADAFLNGKTFVSNVHYLCELYYYENNAYNIFPHGPTIFILPFFAIFGYNMDFGLFMGISAIICIALVYILMLKITKNLLTTMILTTTFAFGTVFFWVSSHLGVWFTNQIFAIIFLLLLLIESFGKKRSFLIGFYLGLAFISRQVTVFYFIFAMWVILANGKEKLNLNNYYQVIKNKNIWKELTKFAFGAGIFVLSYLIINYLKFGNPLETGYEKIIDRSWFGLKYLPWNLYTFFLQAPSFRANIPYFMPPQDGIGQAIIFTSPIFILTFFRKIRRDFAIAIWSTIGLIFISHMLHQNNGYFQFGQRFALDYIPLLFCLLAFRCKDKLSWQLITLSIVSIIFCFNGVLLLRITK